MALDLADFQQRAHEAVQEFWNARARARDKQLSTGKADQGDRSSVTAGKNMNGFVSLCEAIVRSNGLAHAGCHRQKSLLTLPGFFRPTKQWDLLITADGELVAAIELKSHVGPSFGNNFNNRAEEAIGSAHDLWIAYREGAFGKQPPPFVGWLMLVEDAPGSRNPVRERSPHFDVLPEFKATSYVQRYKLLCRKLVQEKLYTSASLITSKKDSLSDGCNLTASSMTELKAFVTSLAGHAAAAAARLG